MVRTQEAMASAVRVGVLPGWGMQVEGNEENHVSTRANMKAGVCVVKSGQLP